jgi:NADH-quinone oxidoreductase subunit M
MLPVQFPLSTLIALPWLGALLVALLRRTSGARLVAQVTSLLALLWTAYVWVRFRPELSGGLQLVERFGPWIAGFDVSYYLAIDGLSVPFLLMGAVLGLGVIWAADPRQYALLLLLEGALFGAFLAVDLVLFYVFFELTLLPAFFLILLSGREEAGPIALRFLLYTMVGSLLLLLAILYVGVEAGRAFNNGVFAADWIRLIREYGPDLPTQRWLLLIFALAFMIKAGLVPLHAWLPDAYAEGPAVLVGLSKLGVYGLLRWGAPLFPNAWAELAPWGALLGAVSVLYGGLLAWSERDMRRLVAYGSIAHMGMLFVGLAATSREAWQGVVWLAVVSTWIVAGLLLLLQDLERRSGGHRHPEAYGGWAGVLPLHAVAFGLLLLGFIGLPGLAGFVGEWLILLGAFRSELLGSTLYVWGAAFGLVLAAAYMLRLWERLFWGELRNRPSGPGIRLLIPALLPVLLLLFGIGMGASYWLRRSEAQIGYLIQWRAEKAEQLGSGSRVERFLPAPAVPNLEGKTVP